MLLNCDILRSRQLVRLPGCCVVAAIVHSVTWDCANVEWIWREEINDWVARLTNASPRDMHTWYQLQAVFKTIGPIVTDDRAKPQEKQDAISEFEYQYEKRINSD